MPRKPSSTTHVTTGESLWGDLGFSPAEAAVFRLKTTLHIELTKAVEASQLAPKELVKVLNVPQPRVRDLLNGKIADVSVEELTEWLQLLGRQVHVTVKKAPQLQGAGVA